MVTVQTSHFENKRVHASNYELYAAQPTVAHCTGNVTTLTACFFVGSFPMILSITALVTGSLLWKFAVGSTSVGFAGGPGVGVGAGPVTVGRGSGATRVWLRGTVLVRAGLQQSSSTSNLMPTVTAEQFPHDKIYSTCKLSCPWISQ
jgi:hypothetical protein